MFEKKIQTLKISKISYLIIRGKKIWLEKAMNIIKIGKL